MFTKEPRVLIVLCLLAVSSVSATASSLYVSDVNLFTVSVFDATTGVLTGNLTPTGGWGTPTGIAVAANGDVYVADFDNSVVDRFSASGSFLGAFISSGLYSPTGLAFGPDGDLYVANFGPGNQSFISRFDSSGNPVDATPFVAASTGLYQPEAIAFGSDGNLYIADSSNGAVDQVVLPTGIFSTLIPTGCPTTPFTNPEGVAFGSNHNLFVSDAGFGCGVNAGSGVYEYDTSGNLIGTFVAPNILNEPTDLVFGPDGNLYVTDNQGRVAEFNGTTGVELADFIVNNGSAGPLIAPTFLAFGASRSASVPEPATLGLMGLGVLGLAELRRRRSRSR